MDGSGIPWGEIFRAIGIIFGVGLLLTILFAAWVFWKVRHIQVPVDADFFDALRVTPLPVVILLDLLDLTLDIFSAPFSWVILGRLGLEPLRMVTVVESLIPGTSFLPTMTIAWVIARFWRNLRIPSLRGPNPF
jgi:hypothetical protein